MKARLLVATALCGFVLAGAVSEAKAGERFIQYTVSATYNFPGKLSSLETGITRIQNRCNSCSEDHSCSCFDYNTLVLMADGSVKKIGEMIEGDMTAYGAVRHILIRRFDQSKAATESFQQVYRGGLYEYRGIFVTGNHMINDDGRWLAVADTTNAAPVHLPHVGTVYNLEVDGGIIPIINPDGETLAFLDHRQAFVMREIAA